MREEKTIHPRRYFGFSIIEVIIAISLINIGLLAISSLVIQNIQTEEVNREYVIASMLAQEGLELVRNIRDNNWRHDLDWKNGNGVNSATDIVQDGDYIIKRDGTIDNSIDNIDELGARLYLYNGFYDHEAVGTATVFYRLITVVDDDPPDNITLTSTVRWKDRSKTYNFVATTKLYNWK